MSSVPRSIRVFPILWKNPKDHKMTECQSLVELPLKKFESVSKVFQNPKLLTDILTYLDLAALLSCRLTCQNWCIWSTEIILSRPNVHTTLLHIRNHGFHSNSSRQNLPRLSLDNLISCLDTSLNFPSTNFRFISGDLRTSSIQTFFSSFGWTIKSLDLSFGGCHCQLNPSWSLIYTLRNLLLNQAPNIEHLTLSYIWHTPCYEDTKQLFPPTVSNVVLPQLKTLKIGKWFSSRQQIIHDILIAAINLEHFCQDNLAPFLIDTILETKRLCCIRKINFSLQNCCNTEYLAEFSKFVQAKPKLDELRICTTHSKGDSRVIQNGCDLISQLLHTSQNTLHTLTIQPMGYLTQNYKINFPPLPSVHTLVLETESCSDFYPIFGRKSPGSIPWFRMEAIFPKSLNLSRIFPNLQAALIDLATDCDLFWKYHFPSMEFCVPKKCQFASVKYLEIQRPCTKLWMIRLGDVFPNVTHILLTGEETNGIVFDVWPYLERVDCRSD